MKAAQFPSNILLSAGAILFSTTSTASSDGTNFYADLTCPTQSSEWNPLRHLGGNGPWSPGPNVFGISPDPPKQCKLDQAVYISRHGSRYPDPGAFGGWEALYEKVKNASFTAEGPLSFLPDWQPYVEDPGRQLRQLSVGGYDELYDFGVELRTRHRDWYQYGQPFRLWANDYERTVDSARLFARGYIGPNSTELGTVYPINGSDPSAAANSLATTDSCPAYDDQAGAGYVEQWEDIYLPPIVERLQTYIQGDFNLTASDVSDFAYLCGFESQILRRDSPFCHVLKPEEFLQYEYRQDLRYWYGTGPESYNNASVFLPVIQGVVDILSSGPQSVVHEPDGSNGTLGPLAVAFTHDNQISQLVARLGIFDEQPSLPPTSMNESRIYVSSRNNPMRGTVTFERLNCCDELFLRIKLNDAVYPVPHCDSGPGQSCPLKEFNDRVLAEKWDEAGAYWDFCNRDEAEPQTSGRAGVTFFQDLTFDGIRAVRP